MWILSSVPAGSKSSPLVASAKGSRVERERERDADMHQIIEICFEGNYRLSESHNKTVSEVKCHGGLGNGFLVHKPWMESHLLNCPWPKSRLKAEENTCTSLRRKQSFFRTPVYDLNNGAVNSCT